ncbi:TetR/AcrR family transcriptional regulator [Sciscionella marina]|uniref:TetR/AcrR family transcriptional regulator n=1 Tax=Sciscionella marina TaxID=508770 RepID=UPI0003728F44|nr:TetR/AcrR family transcriptional regulator [Sciscionella marina]
MERRQEASGNPAQDEQVSARSGGARDRKRSAILEAAEAVFLERGFANATMDLVATTANVSKATVYAKFSSKDELLAEIVASAADRISQEIDRHTDPEEDPRTRLTALARRYAQVLFDPRTVALLRLVVAESHHRPDIGKRYLEAGPLSAIAHLASALQDFVDRGDLAIDDVDHAALQLVGMVQARRLYSLLDPSLLPSDDEITATVTADVEVFLAAYGTGSRTSRRSRRTSTGHGKRR